MLHVDFVNDFPLIQPVLYLEISILYWPLYFHGAKLGVGEVARLVWHALRVDGALWSPTSKKWYMHSLPPHPPIYTCQLFIGCFSFTQLNHGKRLLFISC